MIVRGIEEHPEWLDRFDYFNDAKDTLGHLRAVRKTCAADRAARIDEAIRRLEAGSEEYWIRWSQKSKSEVSE